MGVSPFWTPRRWAARITTRPLFETLPVAKAGEKHGWDGFATSQDKEGAFWVFASVSTGITLNDSAVKPNGPTTHGAVVAFKIAETDGKFALNPVWVSEDMVNPAPPRIANGVVIALSAGNPQLMRRCLY